MADVKWIKITTDIFDDEKILLIESLPDAYSIIVVWFKLLCLAGKMNNSGVFVMSNKIAYTDKMLATIFRMKESTVQLALQTFEQFGMVEIIDGVITIPNWGKHQNLDQLESKKEYMRNYMTEYRARQKALLSGKPNCKANSKTNVSEADKERDKELEGEKEKEIYKEKEKPTTSTSTARATAKSAAVDLFLRKVNPNASGECLRELLDFEAQLGSEVCEYAINYAIDEQKTSWSYIRAILSSFVKDGVLSMDDVRRREQMRKQRSGKSGSRTERNLGNPFLRDDI